MGEAVDSGVAPQHRVASRRTASRRVAPRRVLQVQHHHCDGAVDKAAASVVGKPAGHNFRGQERARDHQNGPQCICFNFSLCADPEKTTDQPLYIAVT